MRFRNPQNGYIVHVDPVVAILLTYLTGCLYLIVHRAWAYALIGFFLAILTCCMSWLIYPVFAPQMIKSTYLAQGWELLPDTDPIPVPKSPNLLGRYKLVGVDRETGFDTELIVDAMSPDNARVKGETKGMIVTSVITMG